MPSTVNSDKIGKPAKQIHAGVQNVSCQAEITATASGTETINLIHIPRGARIHDIVVTADSDGGGTGGESVIVQSATAGKTYLSATWAACAVGARAGNSTGLNAALNYVYTASDTLILQTRNAVGTGTASMTFNVSVSYSVEEDQT